MRSVIANTILVSGLLMLFWVQQAAAAMPPTQPADCSQMPDGRCLYAGYFTNEELEYTAAYPRPAGQEGDQFMLPQLYPYTNFGVTANWSIPQNVVDGASFVNFIGGYLYKSDPSCPINMPNPPAD